MFVCVLGLSACSAPLQRQAPLSIPAATPAPETAAPPVTPDPRQVEVQAPAPVALPAQPVAAPAQPVAADAVEPGAYAWLDRADALLDAIADAPPDFTFDHDRALFYGWRVGETLIVEEARRDDYALYLFDSDGQVFFVRTPDFAAGFDRDRLAVVYTRGGGVFTGADLARDGWGALALRRRGEVVHRAIERRRWDLAAARDWADAQIWIELVRDEWEEQWERDRELALYRRRAEADAARRALREERRRRREQAELFRRWRDGGFVGTPPPGVERPRPRPDRDRDIADRRDRDVSDRRDRTPAPTAPAPVLRPRLGGPVSTPADRRRLVTVPEESGPEGDAPAAPVEDAAEERSRRDREAAELRERRAAEAEASRRREAEAEAERRRAAAAAEEEARRRAAEAAVEEGRRHAEVEASTAAARRLAEAAEARRRAAEAAEAEARRLADAEAARRREAEAAAEARQREAAEAERARQREAEAATQAARQAAEAEAARAAAEAQRAAAAAEAEERRRQQEAEGESGRELSPQD